MQISSYGSFFQKKKKLWFVTRFMIKDREGLQTFSLTLIFYRVKFMRVLYFENSWWDPHI